MEEIVVYTDGGCHGKPGGPGGWAIVVICGEEARSLSGGDPSTTNNRMELTAAIQALTVIKNTPSFTGKKVTVNIDSQYVKNGITVWIKGWKAKGWKKSDGKPALNIELWDELLRLCEIHETEFVWVKGHAGHPENERCDALAVENTEKYRTMAGV